MALRSALRSAAGKSLSKQRISARNCGEKRSPSTPLDTIIVNVNGTHDDNQKTAVADARRTLESAAHFTRGGGAPAPDHDADHARRSSRVEAEQRRLIQWAKENGKLGRSGRLPPAFARGG